MIKHTPGRRGDAPFDFAHTPGPWVVQPGGSDAPVIRDADARLIAAAPELLEALKEAAGMIEDHYRGALGLMSKAAKNKAVMEHVTLAKCRAAITKAEGR